MKVLHDRCRMEEASVVEGEAMGLMLSSSSGKAEERLLLKAVFKGLKVRDVVSPGAGMKVRGIAQRVSGWIVSTMLTVGDIESVAS